MEVTDPEDTYLSLLFYQMVYADQLSVLSRDVVMPAITDDPSSLSEANGGTASVAGGALGNHGGRWGPRLSLRAR